MCSYQSGFNAAFMQRLGFVLQGGEACVHHGPRNHFMLRSPRTLELMQCSDDHYWTNRGPTPKNSVLLICSRIILF